MLLAEMNATEWGIVIGTIVAVCVPAIAAWVAVFVKLSVLQTSVQLRAEQMKQEGHARADQWKQDLHNEANQLREAIARADHSDEIRSLWRVHHHQEGRLYTHDLIMGKLVDRLDLDVQHEPKQPPSGGPRPGR